MTCDYYIGSHHEECSGDSQYDGYGDDSGCGGVRIFVDRSLERRKTSMREFRRRSESLHSR